MMPAHPIEAQFSIPYLIGVAAVKGDVFIEHVTDKRFLFNEKIGEIAKKVNCYVEDDQERTYKSTGSMGAKVEITTKSGKKYEKLIRVARGHHENPMSMNEIAKKFRKCSVHAAKPLAVDHIDRMIDVFTHLEKIRDVSVISDLVTGH